MFQRVWDAAKALPRGKFMPWNKYTVKTPRCINNNIKSCTLRNDKKGSYKMRSKQTK